MSDERSKDLDAERVGRVFRELSHEHLATRRRDERDVIWATLQARMKRRTTSRAGARPRPSATWRLPSLRRPASWLLAAGAAGIVLAVGVLTLPGSMPAYTVEGEDGDTASVTVTEASNERLLRTEALETTIDFADQTRITLRPHTTLKLRVQQQGHVSAWLHQGSVRVRVEHHDQTDYRFHAGPYEVNVVGTTFVLDYEPDTQRLKLELAEGRVLVRDAAGKQREVLAGSRLELPEKIESAEKPVVAADEEAHVADDPPPAPKSPGPAGDGARPPSADFRALARSGRYEEIVRAAEQEGLSHALATRVPGELQELAHAARYTGRTSLAMKVFEELSLKHGGSSPGLRAPFFLGRIAEEAGQLGRALTLYGEYLDRSPRGTYAAEALGRKMALVQRSRGVRAARSIAREYVQRFPDGSYHVLAQSLLEGAPSRGE